MPIPPAIKTAGDESSIITVPAGWEEEIISPVFTFSNFFLKELMPFLYVSIMKFSEGEDEMEKSLPISKNCPG